MSLVKFKGKSGQVMYVPGHFTVARMRAMGYRVGLVSPDVPLEAGEWRSDEPPLTPTPSRKIKS